MRSKYDEDLFLEAQNYVLRSLAAWAIRIIHEEPVNRRAFGNRYTDFHANGARLRLLKDRGEIGLYVSAEESGDRDHWFPVSSVLSYLRRQSPSVAPQLSLEAEIDAAAGVWRQFQDLFAGRGDTDALEAFLMTWIAGELGSED